MVASRREVGPELLLGALAQLAEHSQVGLAVRPAHHGQGTSEVSGVRLVGADVEQIAEGSSWRCRAWARTARGRSRLPKW